MLFSLIEERVPLKYFFCSNMASSLIKSGQEPFWEKVEEGSGSLKQLSLESEPTLQGFGCLG